MWRSVVVFLVLFANQLPGADLDKQLTSAIKQSNDAALCKLLEAVGPEPSRKTVGLLLVIGVENPSRKVYAAVRKALAGLKESSALKSLQKVLSRHKDFRARALALSALGDIPLSETVPLLLPFLKNRDSKIRIQVAKALAKKPFRESVGGLIDILPKADKIAGEYSATVRKSLYVLTNRSFASSKDWEKWWKFEKDTWKPPQGESHGKTELKFIKPPGNFPRFFGVEIFSLRVVFVIDISGSMTEEIRGFTVSRVQLVKAELIKAIQDMRPKTRFSIVAFNSQIYTYSDNLVSASRDNKEKAIRFVRSLGPDGETWTPKALEQAFAFEEANTILLLSDGSPFKSGQLLDKRMILEWVELTNRFRKVTINTLGFPGGQVHRFLKPLADMNGGKYHNATPPERFRTRMVR